MVRPLIDGDGLLILCLFIWIILTLGEPDILDGLIKMVNK